MESTKFDFSNLSNKVLNLKNIILSIIVVLTAWNTYKTDKTSKDLDNAVKNMNINKMHLDSVIERKEFENNLRMQIYQEVKQAITAKNKTEQNIVSTIIDVMLNEDSIFKSKMNSILLSSINTDTAIKNNIVLSQRAEKEILQEQMNPLQEKKSGMFRIDVFYLEDIIQEAKPRAEKIVFLLTKNFPGCNIRLRLLPRSINAGSIYKIESNQIRCKDPNSENAKKLRILIIDNKIFQIEQPQLSYFNYKSSNYISVFVRNM